MIYSERYNYIFVEIPNTGSTAISAELQENYDGRMLTNKHAFIGKARRILGESVVDGAFKFCTVRNPLDAWVSRYEKLKNDHKNNYSRPDRKRSEGGWVPDEQLEMFEFVATGASFKEFIMRFPKSYKKNTLYMARSCDLAMSFENLGTAFRECVSRFGADLVRDLPQVNKTKGKGQFLTYYDMETLDLAKRELGDLMEELGYTFPGFTPGGENL